MKNNEYNDFNEFNKTNEYQKYEMVEKTMNSKETFSSKGENLETEEYGYEKKIKKVNSNKTDEGFIKKIIQKVTQSTMSLASGVAATTVAVATSVVILSSLYTHSPNIELIDLKAGYDFMSYNLYIDDMAEDIDYYAVVSSNFDSYKYELIEGENPNTVYDLRHNMEYDLYVVGVDDANNEEVQYFTTTFYTTVATKNITVRWIVEGEVLQQDTIEYGAEPTYNGPPPSKASTEEYNYTFSGWNETVDEVTGDITYKAEFSAIKRLYNIKWIVEGEVLQQDTIEYGAEITYNGLTPSKASTEEYDYAFSSWNEIVDEVTGDITYTAVFNSIQHEFTATYNQLSASDIIVNYENENYYVMTFNTKFDNSLDSRLSYRIILTDVDTKETYEYKGIDTLANINVPVDVLLLTITYESIGTYNGVEKVFETINMPDELMISNISVDMGDDFALVATDRYQFSMLINSDFASEEVYNSVKLLVKYDDLSTKEIIIEDVAINEVMNITIDVPPYCGSLNIDYTVDLLGANGHNPRIVNGSKEFTLESTFELVRVSADIDGYETSYKSASFEFIYHFTDQDTTIAVKDVETSTPTTLSEGDNFIDVVLDDSLSENEFTYYLSSIDGLAKESETSIAIPILSVTADYEFNYVNPGDAVVTFNDDETMNIYLNTKFETEDLDVWYLVKYRDFNDYSKVYNVKYTESIAYLEDIPCSDYGLEYFVYKTVGNIDYLLRYTIPSGGIELVDDVCYGELTENTDNTVNVSISFYKYYNIDLDSFVLLVDEIEYVISSSEIVYDEESYNYKLNYTLDYMPSELIVQYGIAFGYDYNYEAISSVRQIKGNQYKTSYSILI